MRWRIKLTTHFPTRERLSGIFWDRSIAVAALGRWARCYDDHLATLSTRELADESGDLIEVRVMGRKTGETVAEYRLIEVEA